MYNSNIPTDREIPSTGKLIKSTFIAAIIAAVLLVTVVLPAEYGIDPTGIGNLIGLKKMGEIKVSLAKESAADQQLEANSIQKSVIDSFEADTSGTTVPRRDKMQVTLAPDQGTEIKVKMTKGDTVTYQWSTDGGKANFDAHGDSQKST